MKQIVYLPTQNFSLATLHGKLKELYNLDIEFRTISDQIASTVVEANFNKIALYRVLLSNKDLLQRTLHGILPIDELNNRNLVFPHNIDIWKQMFHDNKYDERVNIYTCLGILLVLLVSDYYPVDLEGYQQFLTSDILNSIKDIRNSNIESKDYFIKDIFTKRFGA